MPSLSAYCLTWIPLTLDVGYLFMAAPYLRLGVAPLGCSCTVQLLHAPENYNGVITHLEPVILECEVKWALGSITMNKASGGDGIPFELFQILKDDTVKVLHSICQQI